MKEPRLNCSPFKMLNPLRLELPGRGQISARVTRTEKWSNGQQDKSLLSELKSNVKIPCPAVPRDGLALSSNALHSKSMPTFLASRLLEPVETCFDDTSISRIGTSARSGFESLQGTDCQLRVAEARGACR